MQQLISCYLPVLTYINGLISPIHHAIKDIPISGAKYIAILYPLNTIIDIANSICINLLDYSYPDNEIMDQLSNLPCVIEVDRVEGPYDIVAKLSDDNMNIIEESIGKHMTRIQGIQSTLTLMSE
jgi:DNA-binding Lrp family transcriptional regulator